MNGLVITALAVALLGASAVGAVAGEARVAAAVPYCDNSNMNMDRDAIMGLVDQLHLSTNGGFPEVDVWNGCLKVSYTDKAGHYHTDFYDPDSLSLVGSAK